MRRAEIVIPVCQALAEEAGKYRTQGIHVLKDVSLANNASSDTGDTINIRDQYSIDGKILMYIGNLESYQGIDLMLDAFAIYRPQHPDASLIIIGGEQKHIDFYQTKCQQLSIENALFSWASSRSLRSTSLCRRPTSCYRHARRGSIHR